jgi:cytochrome b subunit of formate dehydrogenase
MAFRRLIWQGAETLSTTSDTGKANEAVVTSSLHDRPLRGYARPHRDYAGWLVAGCLAFAFAAALPATFASAQNAAPSAPPAAPAAAPAAAAPAAAPAAPAAPAEQAKTPLTNETCLGCHGVEGLLPTDRAHRGGVPGLMTDRFAGSVHGSLKCVDCHQNITQIPHPKTTVQVGCVECHKDLYENAKDEGKTNTKQFAELGKVVTQVDEYLKSIHARPNIKDQSRTNATCYNCHDAHYIYPEGTANYNWWRLNLPYTCGKCHTEELKIYRNSVHGEEVLQIGNAKAAVCSDCHGGMNIQDPFKPETQLAITKNCGKCHKEEWESYLDTYHGQVNKLGFTFTAKCFNCHGSHNIQRVRSPKSSVFPANRLKTCQNCHANATPGFLSFEPHANTYDFARYPYTWLSSKFMLLLLGGVFSFFWTHSALWYYREFRDHQQKKHRPHVQISKLPASGKQIYYNRWPLVWRTAHLLFAISVIFLVLTGMTLFYANSSWAPLISKALGGPRITGIIHRTAAVFFLAIFFWHLAYLAIRLGPKWRTFKIFGPNSLVPNLQDIYDAVAMFKWFFGIAPKPNFDRWSYWEKFDYWAPFWGVAIIGGSGAMIWFKDITASYLPGWVFNVAFIFHGEEAVLAAGFLFTVHFFNNHWRPDKFPLDILMFTGRMPLEEYKREHAVEYQRLVETKQLDKYLVDAPSHPMTVGSKILGFTLMACGLILLYMVISGFIGRLAT